MDFAALQAGLPALLTSLLGIPCQFATQPAKMIKGASARVDLLGPIAIGVDDRELVDVDDAGNPVADPALATAIREAVHGLRELTAQVTVWSPSQRLDESARFYLERLRTRLRWSSTGVALKALGLGLVTIEAIVQLDPLEDGRQRSAAAIDVRLSYGHSETDASAPFIGTVRVKSEAVRDAAGAVLGASLQIDTHPPE